MQFDGYYTTTSVSKKRVIKLDKGMEVNLPLPQWDKYLLNVLLCDYESFLDTLIHLTDRELAPSSPSLTENGSLSDNEKFLLEAFSNLTDEEFEESSPPSFHLMTKSQKKKFRKVKRTSRGTTRRLCCWPDCERVDRGRGLCGYHGGGKRCSAELCEKASRKSGLCASHYHVTHKKPIVERKCRLKPCSEQLV